MFEHLCSKLKDKRKELGYRIEEVVERTKLHPSVIRNIEDGNLNEISSAYLKGFLRIYASFLKVDIEDAFDEVQASVKIKTKEESKPVVIRKPVKEEPKPISPPTKIKEETKPVVVKSKITPSAIPAPVKQLISLTAAVILGLWILISAGKFIISKIPKRPAQPVPVEAKTKQPIKPAEEAKVPAISLSTTPVNAEGVSVSLTAKKKCFLRVKADGKLLFEGILKKGMIETWEARKEVEFRISDGSAVYLEVNGKVISQLTSMPKLIKSLKITPSGISVDK